MKQFNHNLSVQLRLATVLSCLCFCLVVSAQPNSTSVLVGTVVEAAAPQTLFTSDMGTVLMFGTTSGTRLIRFDDAGQVLWAKEYATSSGDWHAKSMTPDLNGGLFIGGFDSWTESSVEFLDPDTAYQQLHYAHLDQNGNVVWEKSLMRTIVRDASSGSYYPDAMDMAAAPNGGVISAFRSYRDMEHMEDVLSFDMTGNLSWARAFGSQPYPWVLPGVPDTNGGQSVSLSVSPTGSIALGYTSSSNMWPMTIALIDQNGGLVWANKVGYNLSGAMLLPIDVGVDQLGGVRVFANLWNISAVNAALFDIVPGGQSVSAELVPVNIWAQYGDLARGPNGETVLLQKPVISALGFAKQWLMHIPDQGSTATLFRKRTTTIGQSHHFLQWGAMRSEQDHITLAGLQVKFDTIFGTYEYQPAFSDRQMDSLFACYWSDTVLTRYAVPASLLSLQADTTVVSTPNDTAYAELPGQVLSVTTFTVPLFSDGCEFLTAVPNVRMETTLTLSSTLLPSDGHITITSTTAGHYMLLDASGKLCSAGRLNQNGTTLLSGSGLSQGIYIVRASDQDGRMIHTAKLIVE